EVRRRLLDRETEVRQRGLDLVGVDVLREVLDGDAPAAIALGPGCGLLDQLIRVEALLHDSRVGRGLTDRLPAPAELREQRLGRLRRPAPRLARPLLRLPGALLLRQRLLLHLARLSLGFQRTRLPKSKVRGEAREEQGDHERDAHHAPRATLAVRTPPLF